MAGGKAQDSANVAARQLATIEKGFDEAARSRRKFVQARFLFGPKKDAHAQPLRLHETLHESNLVDAGLKEEARKGSERFLAQVAAPVEIVAAGQVTFGEMALVGRLAAREAARDRPYGTGVETFQNHGVRHQPRDAAIAVKERVNPQKAVMRRRRREDRVRFADAAIDFLEPRKETRQGAGADGSVPSNAHVAAAQLPSHDAQALMRVGLFHPKHFVGQQFAETVVNFADAIGRHGPTVQMTGVDPALDGNMRLRLKLEIALLGIGAKVVLQRALDIDRVRVVAFDQIAV